MDIQAKIDELIGMAVQQEKAASDELNKPSPTVHDFRKVASLLGNTASKMVEKTSSPLCKLANERLSNTEELEKDAFNKLALSLKTFTQPVKSFKGWRDARRIKKVQDAAGATSGATQATEESGKSWPGMSAEERGKAIKDARTPAETAGTKLTKKQMAGGAAGAVVFGDSFDPVERLTGGKKEKTVNVTNENYGR